MALINPNYPPYYLGNLGYALRLAGQVEQAITAFKAYDATVLGSGFGLTDLVNRTRRSILYRGFAFGFFDRSGDSGLVLPASQVSKAVIRPEL